MLSADRFPLSPSSGSRQYCPHNSTWQNLSRAIAAGQYDASGSMKVHEQLIGQLLTANQDIFDAWGLPLDSDLSSCALLSSGWIALPELTGSLGKWRAWGSMMLARDEPSSSEDSNQIGFYLDAVRQQRQRLDADLTRAFGADPALKGVLRGVLTETPAAIAALTERTETMFAGAATRATPTQHIAAWSAVIDQGFVLREAVSRALASVRTMTKTRSSPMPVSRALASVQQQQIAEKRLSLWLLPGTLLIICLLILACGGRWCSASRAHCVRPCPSPGRSPRIICRCRYAAITRPCSCCRR
ncbi:hypothetical protein [Pantoea sp. 1.19]|uniref:hypothetical protein n=1 Tax=Pantoea sp. 1.19 TaxID=1925589 RepID=UPI000948CEB4|nr:hypothetical protein [Pantoea sp. 1.19]